MGAIVVFGAGGRAGRAAVREAVRRGHRVTAVVRTPAKHVDLAAGGVTVVAGDVTDAAAVGELAEGHEAAIAAVYDPAAPTADFYRAAAGALVASGVPRLVVVGLASILPTTAGAALMDTPGYPNDYRAFYLAHRAGLDVLEKSGSAADWLVISPSGDFDRAAGRTGTYRYAPADATARVSYPDLAVAVVDEVDTPKHHRTHVGVRTA
ncbi:3-beta hydroxysteroid dehydrogenase [Virgisporangium aliadipatigenens]|uniref:3-beta hydroxysteroid dehydrogenase n=1 Tax=Virgisporangium aliadipatigenens TaxID=741659 RepID=A0A8J4DSY1_9ACTN|nr:NAD(P)H-binding protein [Virgisporangium aliadipatigenens]GIJ47697.1 3-beta hydroxysteroid dehydrogenase [Virgisporangium aliadipatigenens]